MSGVNPVNTKGFVGAGVPTDAAVGAGAPHGKAITSHAVAGPALVQAILTVVEVTVEATNENGAGQTGAGAQVTFATQPAAFVAAPLLNLKVKHPSGLDEVKDPGLTVPQYDPANPPGTVPAGFPLKN